LSPGNKPDGDPSSNAADHPIFVDGFGGSAEDIERQWFDKVYTGRGDRMRQLTWRAVLMGAVLGGVLSLTNLYIGLKAGWAFGVAITACILSWATWTSLLRIGLARTPMTILENNCMQSTASAAGYGTGSTLVSAFAAYIMINGVSLPVSELLAWVFVLAVLGVTMAIPMKRQMINVERLRFPSGIAAAATLRSLHNDIDHAPASRLALWARVAFDAARRGVCQGTRRRVLRRRGSRQLRHGQDRARARIPRRAAPHAQRRSARRTLLRVRVGTLQDPRQPRGQSVPVSPQPDW